VNDCDRYLARGLTSRPNTERIGDESLIALFSRFVRHNIWALTGFSTPDDESQFIVRQRIFRVALTFDLTAGLEREFDEQQCRPACQILPHPFRQGSAQQRFR